jgi:hypothetical protein
MPILRNRAIKTFQFGKVYGWLQILFNPDWHVLDFGGRINFSDDLRQGDIEIAFGMLSFQFYLNTNVKGDYDNAE